MNLSVQYAGKESLKRGLFTSSHGCPKTSETPLTVIEAVRTLDNQSYLLEVYEDRMVGTNKNGKVWLCFDHDVFLKEELDKLVLCLWNDQTHAGETFLVKQEKDFVSIVKNLRLICPQQGFHTRYETLEELGKGKNSKVVKVMRKQDQFIFACKIQKNFSGYQTEIQNLRTLKHPNLIYFHEFFIESDYTTYTILDYEDGGSLLSILQQNQELPQKMKMKIVSDLLNGLEYLRIKGIVHRDLKPENILYSRTDGNFKIGDFGLSRKAGTKCNKIVGTPGYMAPEIFSGQHSQVCFSMDIYSMGLIFFELFTGKQYYEGKNQEQILKINTKGISRKKRQNNGHELKQVEKDLLEKMIRLNPGNRKNSLEILSSHCFNQVYKSYGRNSGSTKSKQSDESDQDSGLLMGTFKKLLKIRSSC